MTPEELLKQAQGVPVKHSGPLAAHYLDTIGTLREKNLSWAEIYDFFAAAGLKFSLQTLQSVWSKHCRNGGGA